MKKNYSEIDIDREKTTGGGRVYNHPLYEKIFILDEKNGSYDLDHTFSSGQTFRWNKVKGGWEGIIYGRWVRLERHPAGIRAEICERVSDWQWLEEYLQIKRNINAIIKTFPEDSYLRAAVKACRGLRIVQQDPWECLATFLMSSSKQITQIKQIINNLCERFGKRILSPDDRPLYAFPDIETIANASEEELRACKMGFRAAYLKKTAEEIIRRNIHLPGLASLPMVEAREILISFPGVGSKIADCVLLFSLGFLRAFPVDVWVTRALQTYYFESKPVPRKMLEKFATEYFGKYGGYAQQYLFHYIRMINNRV